jgi:SAM-dependent methyltransferase
MDRAGWDERYREAGWIWSLTPNRFVAEELAGSPPGRALDLACGEGRNALWLAQQGWKVTAVDFSEVALEKARKRAASAEAQEIAWMAADVTRYEPEAGGYDLVLIAYLHLLPADLDPVLRRAVQALAPGGTALVVGHDATNPAEGVGGPQDPRVLYTPDAVAASLAPLRAVRAERALRAVDGEEKPAIDTVVVAVREV